jgi:hypothetical protein
MERVVSRPNMLAACKRVRENKGSPGVDGRTVEDLPAWLRGNWERVREELLADFVRGDERVHGIVNALKSSDVACRQLFDCGQCHAFVRAVDCCGVDGFAEFVHKLLLVAHR